MPTPDDVQPSKENTQSNPPPIPPKPPNFRMAPKPASLKDTTVAEQIERQQTDLKATQSIAPPVPPKPFNLRNTTVAEHFERQKTALKIEQGDGTKGRSELYDVYKHGPPSFNGHFVRTSGDGGLVFKDEGASEGSDKGSRLVHIPAAVREGLTKDKAANALIVQSMQSGEKVRFYNNADEWKVRKAPEVTKNR
jgi:hypothetical protein